MALGTKKLAIYAAVVVIAIGLLFLGQNAYMVHKNKPDMDNLLAIAGLSGAKIFTLDSTPELQKELEKSAKDPKQAVGVLERALKQRMGEQAAITKTFPKVYSPQRQASFETNMAYAFRLLILKQWHPGMSRREIVQIYSNMTNGLTSDFDFYNHTVEFLGFQ